MKKFLLLFFVAALMTSCATLFTSGKARVNINSLNHLERLNLYGTNVTDKSLETFASIKSLKKIYLWNTKVSKEKIDEFNQENKSKEALLDF